MTTARTSWSLTVAAAIALLSACGGGRARELEREVTVKETQNQLTVVARAIDMHRARERELPAELSELVAKKLLLDKQIVDAWGRPLRYEVTGPREFELCSAGPDEATKGDDICHKPQ